MSFDVMKYYMNLLQTNPHSTHLNIWLMDVVSGSDYVICVLTQSTRFCDVEIWVAATFVQNIHPPKWIVIGRQRTIFIVKSEMWQFSYCENRNGENRLKCRRFGDKNYVFSRLVFVHKSLVVKIMVCDVCGCDFIPFFYWTKL